MSNYILKRTDPANPSIVVQPYTVNGPSTPASTILYSNPLSGLSAVVESTSLVLAGKGVPEYGELVQNNLIYLTENFASPVRPRNPLQGQMWYKNTAGVDSTNPTDPTTVGLYIWSGTVWTPVVLSSSGSGSGDLDMGGNHIINVADPVNPQDVVTLNYADDHYLSLTGGSLTGSLAVGMNLSVAGDLAATGNLTVTGTSTFNDDVTFAAGSVVIVTNTPTANLHATNKIYVDDAIAAATGGTAAYLPLSGGIVAGPLDVDNTASITEGVGEYGNLVPGSGYVPGFYTNVAMTGGAGTGATADIQVNSSGEVDAIFINDPGIDYAVNDVLTASNVDLGGTGSGFSATVTMLEVPFLSNLTVRNGVGFRVQGTGTASFGGRIVNSVGDPISSTDAANKQYVDDAVLAVTPLPDKYVTSGVLSSGGALTLTMSDASSILVTGQFAQQVHTHSSTAVTYAIPTTSQSYLTSYLLSNQPAAYPNAQMDVVTRTFDRAMSVARSPVQRTVVDATTGTTYTLPGWSPYLVNEGRLAVYSEGTKLVASERGNSRIKFTANNIGLTSNTGLAAGTYNVTIAIDGGTPFVVDTTIGLGGSLNYRQIQDRFNFIFQGSPSTAVPATPGRVNYSWTGLVGTNPSGLANDATVYTATITVDGVAKPISVTGSAGQTLGTVVAKINSDLGSAGAAVIASSTNLLITSATTGVTSTVAIADTNLFSSLTGVGTPVATAGAAAIPSAPTTTVYPASARYEQQNGALWLVLESNAVGTGSSVTASYAVGELFTSITTSSAPINTSVTVNRDYAEVGNPGTLSTSVEFAIAPTAGDVLEFVVTP